MVSFNNDNKHGGTEYVFISKEYNSSKFNLVLLSAVPKMHTNIYPKFLSVYKKQTTLFCGVSDPFEWLCPKHVLGLALLIFCQAFWT